MMEDVKFSEDPAVPSIADPNIPFRGITGGFLSRIRKSIRSSVSSCVTSLRKCGLELLGGEEEGRTTRRLVWAYACIHGCCDQSFSAAYKALEAEFGLKPTALAAASSFAKLAHAASCPAWGFLVDGWEGSAVLTHTAITWGISTALLAFIGGPVLMLLLPLLFVSGVAMAAMGPVTQKLLAAAATANNRGSAYGNLSFFQSLGRMMALMTVTSLARISLAGIMGWRWCFVVLGGTSIALAVLAARLLPGATSGPLEALRAMTPGRALKQIKAISYVGSNKSFWLMLTLGVLNGMPRSALSFVTMYFQCCGLSDAAASFVVSVSWITAMLVSPVVGRVSDAAARRFEDRGRAALAQGALALRAVLMLALLRGLEPHPSNFAGFVVLSGLVGLMAGWPGVGANRPVLTEIVMPQHRATAFALVATTEGIGAALLGAPLVGMLAENVFGYVLPKKGHLPEKYHRNADALGSALAITTVGPWLISLGLYQLLMRTYKQDRAETARRVQSQEHGSELADLDLEATANLEISRIKSGEDFSSIDNPKQGRDPHASLGGGYVAVRVEPPSSDMCQSASTLGN